MCKGHEVHKTVILLEEQGRQRKFRQRKQGEKSI